MGSSEETLGPGDVCIGVCADIQYRSDKDDKFLEKHRHTRSYRAALPKAVEAMKQFSSRGVSHVIHLGDIIDGRSYDQDPKVEMPNVVAELDEVARAFGLLPGGTEVLHIVGNHCLYVGRDFLQKRLSLERSYYVKDLSKAWRAVVLDTVYISMYYSEGDPRREEAGAYLEEHDGEPNATTWNGMIGAVQAEWLRSELTKAREDGVRCLVCGHHPMLVEASSAEHVMWGAEDSVLPLFKEFSDVVAAYFCGHFHSGGYAKVDGVHHLTVASILDSDETNSYAFVTFAQDRIAIEGVGHRGPISQTLALAQPGASIEPQVET